MELNIDFNNPRILQGYKEQALPQAELEESKGRVIVGSEGGLAYALFQDRDEGFPLQFRVSSSSEIATLQDYFDGVEMYIEYAGKHAEQRGFGLVTVGDKEVISDGCTLDDFLYGAGIGSVNIDSAERFQSFLEMVKSGMSELDEQYENLVKKAVSFPTFRATILR